MIGTKFPPIAAFFEVQYVNKKEDDEVYANWQQFLMNKDKVKDYRTLSKEALFYTGGPSADGSDLT